MWIVKRYLIIEIYQQTNAPLNRNRRIAPPVYRKHQHTSTHLFIPLYTFQRPAHPFPHVFPLDITINTLVTFRN
jgi:hypothetical protein